MRPGRRLVIRLSALSGLVVCLPLVSATAQRPTALAVLQVPYLSQTELLCGGAAVAMLERWWGRRGVYAEEFANLVRRERGGILSTELAAATRARGWRVDAISGTAAAVGRALRDSVPVIAMIQVARNRFHYVVIVAWGAERVVYHDPADAPFVSIASHDFLVRWGQADNWAMLVTPLPSNAAVAPGATIPRSPISVDSLPCRPWLDAAADAASEGRLGAADSLLGTAGASCPMEALLLRELAGVRFRQGRYGEAARLVAEFLQRTPDDTLGWQLLASSRYLAGDRTGALVAWGRVGGPRVDLVSVDGIHRTRFAAAERALDLRPGLVLTANRLALARRRVADIPAFAFADVDYLPVGGGLVEVRAVVVERPLVEPVRRQLIRGAIGAFARRELGFDVLSPLRSGEQWSAQWRWQPANPRRAGRLEIPVTLGIPGAVELEQSWEEYRFADRAPLEPVPTEQRRGTRIGFRGWLRRNLEMTSALRYERWREAGDFLVLGFGGAMHSRRDRVVLMVQGEESLPLKGQSGYVRAQAGAAWRLPAGFAGLEWSMRAGVDVASPSTPRGLWPIAGGNAGKPIPLRAHRSVVDDSLPTSRSGQQTLHGGVAVDRALVSLGPVPLGIGAFVDLAAVMVAGSGRRSYLDVGAGLRLGIPGAPASALRIDVARGMLTDRRWGISVGLEHPWPMRMQGMR